MEWFWDDPTQLAFGDKCVEDHLPRFMPAGSRVVCIYDEANVSGNPAKSDVESALSSLGCAVLWQEGVHASPEYDDLVASLPRLRSFEPDFLVAIGVRLLKSGWQKQWTLSR